MNNMSSMQGFGGNCIGRNARKNVNNGKNALSSSVAKANNMKNTTSKTDEITDIPLYRVLTTQTKKMEKQNSDLISPNFDDVSEEYEMSDSDHFNLDEENLENLQPHRKNIKQLINMVDQLDVSQEKKHDYLLETVNLPNSDFKFIDTIHISDDEKLKRKLAYIDEAYQDKDMKLKKRAQLLKSSKTN